MTTQDLKPGMLIETRNNNGGLTIVKVTEKRVSWYCNSGFNHKANVNKISIFWGSVKEINKYLKSGHWFIPA